MMNGVCHEVCPETSLVAPQMVMKRASELIAVSGESCNGLNNGLRDTTWRVFSCDQVALWMVQSVRLFVCPSVCHTFLTMFPLSYHHEIFRSYYQSQRWLPCKRSRSEVKGQCHRGYSQLSRFLTVTQVWIHIWRWHDAQSLMLLRRGALLFFKVIRQISRSHGKKIDFAILTQIRRFRIVTPVWIHQWLRNDAQRLKLHRRGTLLFFKVICQIWRSNGT